MELLFVPLCVTIPKNVTFDLYNQKDTYRQNWWDTQSILSKKKDYSEYNWLFDQLPFIKIENFFYKIQKGIVNSHIDYDVKHAPLEKLESIRAAEPAGYHVVLHGKNDSLEIFDGSKWVNPIMPDAPMAYLLNQTTCYHRVKEDHLRNSLYIEGEIDINKHKLLIKQSLEKYGNLAVYKKEPLWQKSHQVL